MNSQSIKNWAVTGLSVVTALVLVFGYRRLDQTLSLVEARSDALYSIAVTAEQRNRAAIDESAQVGKEVNAVLSQIRADILPRAARLLNATTVTAQEHSNLASAGRESVEQLSQTIDTSVQQVSAAATLGLTQVNQQVGQSGEEIQKILSHISSIVHSDQVSGSIENLAATSLHVRHGSEHLSETLDQLRAASVDLKNTTAHAPAIAESVDKIFQQQQKWSGALLLLRVLSLIR